MTDHTPAGGSATLPTANLETLLQKPRRDFTRRDLAGLVRRHGIRMVNFRFVAGDGRLRTLNFVVQGDAHVDRILTAGERVDGSNLFRNVDPGRSDLYVVPVYSKAFLNPFSPVPALDVMCSFFTSDGEPLPGSPDNILRRACQVLEQRTGYALETLAELEYYIVSGRSSLYPGAPQRGYTQSAPFAHFEHLRVQAMALLADMGCRVKYGHSEVGRIHDAGQEFEQHEIEFALAAPEASADAVVLARWVLRMLSEQHGVTVTFTPKLVHGHAGSGLHVHTRLVKDDRNATGDENGLTDVGKHQLAGFLTLADSLTAFGNTLPVSYLRLVPNQEAPVYVCWGERNRSALVRVPLGWTGVKDMAAAANPREPDSHPMDLRNFTLEFRSPDGSADIHLLHAGLAVAARHGLEMPDALAVADRLKVSANVFHAPADAQQAALPRLPTSCSESAQVLLRSRAIYEAHGVFSPEALDNVAAALNAFGYEEDLCRGAGFEELNKIIEKYLHCT